MKIMIATPAYSGKVNVQYAISYANTKSLLESKGVQVQPFITASGSLLVAERNRIIEEFWQSDCTHILCVDGDLGWPAEAVIAMLSSGKEFVCGVYPARRGDNEFLFRPKLNENGSIQNENNLLRVDYIPAGFMLISRSVIQKMRDKHPDLYFCPKDPSKKHEAAFCFFNTEVWEDEFWGEDYVFCRKAREAGVDIWVDPFIQFDHDGTIGMLIESLHFDKTKAGTISEAA